MTRAGMAGRLLLLSGGTACALLGAEGVLRRLQPDTLVRGADEMPDFRRGGGWIRAQYETDSELGFKPVMNGREYGPFGTMANPYPAQRRPGVARVLFLGDSVTRRGRIVAALKTRYGEDRYEYWNAGVESYNTVQEVAYYKRYCRPLRPDHVILTFHLNDFETTPVAFLDGAGRLVVAAPRRTLRSASRWLFEHSLIYRTWLDRAGRDGGSGARDPVRFTGEVRRGLTDLRDLTQADGTALTVLVLPILAPFPDWREEDRARRATVLAMLAELRVRHFDLLGAMEKALAEGVTLGAAPGDGWHPSVPAAESFGAVLHASGLLPG